MLPSFIPQPIQHQIMYQNHTLHPRHILLQKTIFSKTSPAPYPGLLPTSPINTFKSISNDASSDDVIPVAKNISNIPDLTDHEHESNSAPVGKIHSDLVATEKPDPVPAHDTVLETNTVLELIDKFSAPVVEFDFVSLNANEAAASDDLVNAHVSDLATPDPDTSDPVPAIAPISVNSTDDATRKSPHKVPIPAAVATNTSTQAAK